MIRDSGYEHTFLVFGIGQGIIVMLAALLLTAPDAAYKDRMLAGRPTANTVTRRQYGPSEMVRTPVFWLMYLMFVLMAAGGLMATASLAPSPRTSRSTACRSRSSG